MSLSCKDDEERWQSQQPECTQPMQHSQMHDSLSQTVFDWFSCRYSADLQTISNYWCSNDMPVSKVRCSRWWVTTEIHQHCWTQQWCTKSWVTSAIWNQWQTVCCGCKHTAKINVSYISTNSANLWQPMQLNFCIISRSLRRLHFQAL